MSLSPDRLDHFRGLLNDPRYAHGANLVPIPMPRGAVAELLKDAKEVEKLRAAIAAVIDWCDTNQHPFHPSEGAPGFSSQDWALDDAARRIRTAIHQHLGGSNE